MSISSQSGARGLQRLPCLKCYNVLQWKVDSSYGGTLQKLLIIWENMSNENCSELNSLQNTQWKNIFIYRRSGGRVLQRFGIVISSEVQFENELIIHHFYCFIHTCFSTTITIDFY